MEPAGATTAAEPKAVERRKVMAANTGMAARAEKLRKRGHALVDGVADLVARGHREPKELEWALGALQGLKNIRPARKGSGRIRIINNDTRVVNIEVRYNHPMEWFGDMVWATPDRRTDHVPPRTKREVVEIVLRRFGVAQTFEDLFDTLEKEGLEPLGPEGLRDLKKTIQANGLLPHPIIAAGASWRHPDGFRSMPYFMERWGHCFLVIPDKSSIDWEAHCWFAARRKRS